MNTLTFTFGSFSLLDTNTIKYGFIAQDDGGFNHSNFEFNSLEDLKSKFPTRLSILSAHEETLCYSNLDYLVDNNDNVTTPSETTEIYDRFGQKHEKVFKEILFIGDEQLYS